MIKAAIDWGSSSFRAYHFDEQGQPVDFVEGPFGIKTITDNDFETVLKSKIGHWLQPGDTVLLSGMITSKNGWVESNYINCPAVTDSIIDAGKHVTMDGINLVFLPGLCQSSPADVMRGEELQLLGTEADGICVIPGTHSKWAQLEGGKVLSFRTIPTGELFDLISNYSLIGALTDKQEFDHEAFNAGVDQGYRDSLLLSNLFTVRSSVLMQQRSGVQSYAWLSGLLIGSEIREGNSLISNSITEVLLIGSEQLCEKYSRALQHLGITANLAPSDITLKGFQRIIKSNSCH